MAIYTGGMRQEEEQIAAAERIAAQQAKAETGEVKRKGRSDLFGKALGWAAGEGLSTLAGMALTGITGGAINPMTLRILKAGVKGIGLFGGKAAAHQATTGKWGKQLKTSGQVGKIEAGGKYGYGIKQAETLSQALAEERKSKQDWGTLAGDVGGAIVADVGMEKLGGFAKEKVGGMKFGTDAMGGEQTLGDWAARNYGIGGEDYASKVTAQGLKDNPFLDDDSWDLASSLTSEPIGQSDEVSGLQILDIIQNKEQGGQVMDQQQLMALLALAQMQQQEETAYSDTALEEEKQQSTIADMFASQGKTLGGNNTQSLSQMLGR